MHKEVKRRFAFRGKQDSLILDQAVFQESEEIECFQI